MRNHKIFRLNTRFFSNMPPKAVIAKITALPPASGVDKKAMVFTACL
jgi:hypothetical protein